MNLIQAKDLSQIANDQIFQEIVPLRILKITQEKDNSNNEISTQGIFIDKFF